MTSAFTTELRRLRRATNGRPATIAALVVAIIVILVAAPQAQQPAPRLRTGGVADRGSGRMRRADRRRPAGRPLDHPQHRRRHLARLADRAGHRRRDGHRAVAAADSRQAARHDLAVRVGPRRRDQDLRGQGPPRPDAAHRPPQAAVPGRAHHRHGQRQGRGPLGHGLEQVRHRQGRGRRRAATSRRKRTSSTCCSSRRAWRRTR